MFDEFAKAIMGANTAGATGPSIYSNFFASDYNASPAQFAGRKSAVQADIDERARREGAAEAEAKKNLDAKVEADKADPSKAKMVMRADRSGYDFFDGTGQPMNINQFSLLTGKRPDELLADSDNPRDQKFVADYQTMRTLSNAWVNGDTETLAKYRQADPEKFNQLVTQYKNPNDMVKGFMGYYSDYYGITKNTNTPDQARFSPGDPRADGKPYGADRSITLTDPTTGAVIPGSVNLQQTLTPTTMQAPTSAGGLTGFIQEHADPFGLSNYQQKKREYDDFIKANPWAAYQKSLMGR